VDYSNGIDVSTMDTETLLIGTCNARRAGIPIWQPD
jgi:hypothetical protein